jgi:hypothetical protein
MIPVEIIPGMGEGEDKGEWWKGWIQAWYILYIIRTFVNATMYPQHNNKKIPLFENHSESSVASGF